MNNRKPIFLIFIGSITTGFASFLLLIFYHFFVNQLSTLLLIGTPFLTSIFTFLIFSYLINVFLKDRLRLIYRTIRKGKFTKEDDVRFKLKEDVISNAEEAALEWSEERNKEISKLKEQEEFRREFLGNLAHELKTPVFSIQGYVLTLLDGALEDSSVNTLFLERASKATDRITRILEDLDEITRLEVEDLKIEFKPFDIYELTQEVFESFEIIAKEKNIKLTFAKDHPNGIIVLGDRGKIGQVLTNLIGNSIFYGNEGGETIARFYIVDGIVTIEISDNGPGIEDQYISRLFERFYRV